MDKMELPRGNQNRSTFYRLPPRGPNRSISPLGQASGFFFGRSAKIYWKARDVSLSARFGKLSVHMSGKGEIGHAINLETGKI